MVSAYILIQTEVGKATHVTKTVDAIEGVVQVDGVTGPYDVIARAEAPSLDDLGKLVIQRIQSVAGVSRTLTCPVLHE
jgi:DNA-binding Lrp family transcriptional regulator